MNDICHSMNVDRLLFLLVAGGDISALNLVIELIWTFCIHRWWGYKNLVETAFISLYTLCNFSSTFAPFTPSHQPLHPLHLLTSLHTLFTTPAFVPFSPSHQHQQFGTLSVWNYFGQIWIQDTLTQIIWYLVTTFEICKFLMNLKVYDIQCQKLQWTLWSAP